MRYGVTGRAMLQKVSRRPHSQRRLGFAPRSAHMEFVADKVALGQVFSPITSVSLLSIIPLWPSTLYIIWGMQYRLVGGRTSET
jgi:hypothetical protein